MRTSPLRTDSAQMSSGCESIHQSVKAAALPQRLRERLQLDTTSVLDLSLHRPAGREHSRERGQSRIAVPGGLTAIMLAILGILAQTLMAARQRMTQFAVLRTLGLLPGRVTRILLVEQALVYLFGVVGGTFLGGLLLPAIVPFLGFGETTGDLTMVGVPPDQVVLDLPGVAAFYLALVVVFLLALELVMLCRRIEVEWRTPFQRGIAAQTHFTLETTMKERVLPNEIFGQPLLAIDVDDADAHLRVAGIHDVPAVVALLQWLGHHVIVVGVDAAIQAIAAGRADVWPRHVPEYPPTGCVGSVSSRRCRRGLASGADTCRTSGRARRRRASY